MKEEGQELIEKYFARGLSQSEQETLDAQLENDEELKRLFKRERILVAGIKNSARKELLKKLKAVEESLPAIKAGGKVIVLPLSKYAMGIAATLAIAVTAFFLLFNQKPTAQDLYKEFYQPYPNLIAGAVRGGEEVNTESIIRQAMRAYDHGDYRQTVDLLQSIPEAQLSAPILLYIGNAHLALNESAEAIPFFQRIISDYKDFNPQARWYLSLAYLLAGDEHNASAQLTTLKEGASTYKEKAEKLLHELE